MERIRVCYTCVCHLDSLHLRHCLESVQANKFAAHAHEVLGFLLQLNLLLSIIERYLGCVIFLDELNQLLPVILSASPRLVCLEPLAHGRVSVEYLYLSANAVQQHVLVLLVGDVVQPEIQRHQLDHVLQEAHLLEVTDEIPRDVQIRQHGQL